MSGDCSSIATTTPQVRQSRDVDVGLRRDLTGDDDEAGRHEHLTCNLPAGVAAHHLVEDSVRDLVGHLVGVAFRDRLGGEEKLARHPADGSGNGPGNPRPRSFDGQGGRRSGR
jgi:hypothetical protein